MDRRDLGRGDRCRLRAGPVAATVLVLLLPQVVAVVDGESRIQIKPVRLARDLGERVVVASGLTIDDRVVVSPNALLRPGDQVEVAAPPERAVSSAK